MTCGDPPPLAWVFRSHLEPPPRLGLWDQKGTLGLGVLPSG